MKYIDSHGCMLESGNADEGKGDALWRTSLAFICYPWKQDLYLGVHRCLTRPPRRHPTLPKGECSRDQILMAIVALEITGYLLPEYEYRFCPDVTMRDVWLWYKGIKGSSICRLLWRFIAFFTVWFMPGYAVHLWAWQVYTLPGKKPILSRIGRLVSHKDNKLISLLMGKKVNVEDYIPHNDFMWQRNNRGSVKMSDLIETPDEKYPIDLDILKVICQKQEKWN